MIDLARPVLTKRDFVRRYKKGEFGNAAPTWNCLAEFVASKYKGLVHIRNRVAGGPTWYNLKPEEAKRKWIELVQRGTTADSLYISGMAPHHIGTIQGEIIQSEDHITVTVCSAQKPMREAMADGVKTVKGIMSVGLLRQYMDPGSYDWMEYLLDAYPGHVLEFSCFERAWGTVPHRNTVWWEIRNY